MFDIDDKASFGIHVYSYARENPNFEMATYIYHPEVVVRSKTIYSQDEEPGLKDRDGNWDMRPHQSRINRVTDTTLATWHAVLEDDTVPIRQTRMVYAVNRSTEAVLNKLSKSKRIGDLGLEFSAGWHEKNDRTKGYFDVSWGPVSSWDDAILQGPHLFVGNPFYKSPNPSMLHNQDWSAVDLETLPPDALPVTAYKPSTERAKYDAAYTHWGPERDPARAQYRIAWRNMAANTGERTLIPAIIPPGAAHVDGIFSLGRADFDAMTLVVIAGEMGSLPSDVLVRSAPKSTIRSGTAKRLPHAACQATASAVALRVLRLQAATGAYSALWDEAYVPAFRVDTWAGGVDYENRPLLGAVTETWQPGNLLRVASDRRQALVEIDALVALSLGLTADELCTIYRTQFAVLYGYDHNSYFYDANGRLVPNEVLKVWRTKHDSVTEAERTATNASGNTYVYELPFVTLDREADMRQAYSHFERVLAERS